MMTRPNCNTSIACISSTIVTYDDPDGHRHHDDADGHRHHDDADGHRHHDDADGHHHHDVCAKLGRYGRIRHLGGFVKHDTIAASIDRQLPFAVNNIDQYSFVWQAICKAGNKTLSAYISSQF